MLYYMCMVRNSVMVRGSLADFINLLFALRKVKKHAPCRLCLRTLIVIPIQLTDNTKIFINVKMIKEWHDGELSVITNDKDTASVVFC